MPTDVNNLKDGQEVAIIVTVTDSHPNNCDSVEFYGGDACFRKSQIITDWPPEDKPSADDVGWETLGPFGTTTMRPDGYEYRSQRRPLAPKWVPTAGETAWWEGEIVTVLAIDDDEAWVRAKNGYRFEVLVADLTQPKEGGQ